MKNTIVLKKVSIKIDGKFILKNISFSTSPDKPLCIIGTGSSGKSSLLKSILGLVKISSGKIFINGQSIDVSAVTTPQGKLVAYCGYIP